MTRIAGVVLMLAGCGGRDPFAVCSSIALGTELSTLPQDPNPSNCVRDMYSAAAGPIEDALCCAYMRPSCNMSCTPPITTAQIGPAAEPQPRNVYWCCVYVREGKVIARAVQGD